MVNAIKSSFAFRVNFDTEFLFRFLIVTSILLFIHYAILQFYYSLKVTITLSRTKVKALTSKCTLLETCLFCIKFISHKIRAPDNLRCIFFLCSYNELINHNVACFNILAHSEL